MTVRETLIGCIFHGKLEIKRHNKCCVREEEFVKEEKNEIMLGEGKENNEKVVKVDKGKAHHGK